MSKKKKETVDGLFSLQDENCIVIQPETMKRKPVLFNLFMSNNIKYDVVCVCVFCVYTIIECLCKMCMNGINLLLCRG